MPTNFDKFSYKIVDYGQMSYLLVFCKNTRSSPDTTIREQHLRVQILLKKLRVFNEAHYFLQFQVRHERGRKLRLYTMNTI